MYNDIPPAVARRNLLIKIDPFYRTTLCRALVVCGVFLSFTTSAENDRLAHPSSLIMIARFAIQSAFFSITTPNE